MITSTRPHIRYVFGVAEFYSEVNFALSCKDYFRIVLNGLTITLKLPLKKLTRILNSSTPKTYRMYGLVGEV